MRRLAALALAVAAVAAACTLSTVDQDADVTVRGTVQRPDGRPLDGATVVLLKEADFGEAVLGATLVAGTLGSVCLADEPPAGCGKARRATTDGDGAYSFRLKGKDTQGSVGNASTFHLSTGSPAGGPTVNVRFRVQRTEVTVPLLRLWAPTFELVTEGAVRATWTSLEGADDERLVFFDRSAHRIIWSHRARGSASFDARILEDGRGTALVEALDEEDGEGTTFQVAHRSSQAGYAARRGPAPSRNAPCTPAPCAATDGDLAAPATVPPPAPEVTVDLVTPRRVSLVVVRGCPARCDLETSADGSSWAPAGAVDEPFAAVTPPAGSPVRHLRVRSTSDLSRMTEVSAW